MTGAPFFDRRFVVMCGKGGVGRSTLCAAVAIEAARRGKRVLVCELNTKERIPSLLGGRPGGPVITHAWSPPREEGSEGSNGGNRTDGGNRRNGGNRTDGGNRRNGGNRTGGSNGRNGGGVWCVNVVPEHAMREYGLMKLRVRALYRVAFENRLVRGFLRLVPGLPELLMLGKAFFHEQELNPTTGKPQWDMVVVDAPATGHGVSLLRIPQVVLAITSHGPMADDARRMQRLLTDPVRTSLNIVTLPEAMPVAEAIDLRRQLEQLLHLPTGYVFLNAVRAGVGDKSSLDELDRLAVAQARALPTEGTDADAAGAQAGTTAALVAIASAGRRRASRAKVQDGHIARLLDEVEMPVISLPFIAAQRWRFEAISKLSGHLTEAVARLEAEDAP